MPNLPNNPAGPNIQATLKGPISLAVAKETLFLTTDATLLEQVLRPGVATGRQPDLPDRRQGDARKISGTTFVRPDEQARLSYDMIKSGQFEKAIRQAMAASRGGQRSRRFRVSSTSASFPISRSSPST